MNVLSARTCLAGVAALIVLPALEFFVTFVVSGGAQSLRGSFNLGHAHKYLEILLLYEVPWTLGLVAAGAAAILAIAALARDVSTLFTVGISIPIGALLVVAFLVAQGAGGFPYPWAVWAMGAFSGAITSLIFCVLAGIPLKRASRKVV